jgi:hypothetical protein
VLIGRRTRITMNDNGLSDFGAKMVVVVQCAAPHRTEEAGDQIRRSIRSTNPPAGAPGRNATAHKSTCRRRGTGSQVTGAALSRFVVEESDPAACRPSRGGINILWRPHSRHRGVMKRRHRSAALLLGQSVMTKCLDRCIRRFGGRSFGSRRYDTVYIR